jgi:hypothetical protein
MPRKIKIVKESEEDESLEKTPIIAMKEITPKEKKPRTEKQIEAFKNMIEKRKQKVQVVTVLPSEEPEEESEEEEIQQVQDKNAVQVLTDKKKRGRPTLSLEKIQEKQTMKEKELEKQLKKLEMKIQLTAKKEAKKKVLDKIKSKMMEENEEDDEVSSDTDEEIHEILKKQKKPIVIVNKIEKAIKQPRVNPNLLNQPTGAYFV